MTLLSSCLKQGLPPWPTSFSCLFCHYLAMQKKAYVSPRPRFAWAGFSMINLSSALSQSPLNVWDHIFSLVSLSQALLGLFCYRGRWPVSWVGMPLPLQRLHEMDSPGLPPALAGWEAKRQQHGQSELPTMWHGISHCLPQTGWVKLVWYIHLEWVNRISLWLLGSLTFPCNLHLT